MAGVDILIKKNGKVEIEAHGFEGSACEEFVAKFSRLGEQEETHYKEEYYMNNYLTASEEE